MNRDIVIKNIDRITFDRIKLEADKQGTDMRTVIIRLLKKALSPEKRTDKNISFNDLDKLAGTWTEEEYKSFKFHTSRFEQIDEELWK